MLDIPTLQAPLSFFNSKDRVMKYAKKKERLEIRRKQWDAFDAIRRVGTKRPGSVKKS